MKIRNLLCQLLLLVITPAIAAADAGSALRDYKDTNVLRQEKQQPEEIQRPAQVESAQETDRPVAEGPEVHIATINVVGNTTLSPEELNQVLAPYTGSSLTAQEIHAAADALMRAIRKKGAFTAKVYILPQDIADHTVTFNVIEGHLAKDGIVLGRSSQRVKDEIIKKQLVHTLKPGSKITADKYERAIYLTNDLPGIKGSENLIFPADKAGEAGFETIVEDQSLVTGDLYYDNFGSYFTGRNRWGSTVFFNSPTGRAEHLVVGGNVSDEGTFFGYLDANLLLYPNGLRGGVTFDYLDYKTDQEGNLRGSGQDVGMYLHYPIIRSRLLNLYSDLAYTYTTLDDEDDLGTITDRKLNVGSLEIYGDKSDHLLGGGVTTARLGVYVGDVDLDDYAPYADFDAQHADTQGSFSRATLSLARLQHLVGNLQTYIALRGQIASKRMDPSQAIAFGGPYDFPGYHTGEIFGDEGWMVHTDLRYNLSSLPWHGDLQLSVFYDYGYIRSHTVAIVNGFPVPGAVDNGYTVQSAGFGLSQTWKHFVLQGLIGWQVDNEIPDSLLDDGGESDFQAWIHLDYFF